MCSGFRRARLEVRSESAEDDERIALQPKSEIQLQILKMIAQVSVSSNGDWKLRSRALYIRSQCSFCHFVGLVPCVCVGCMSAHRKRRRTVPDVPADSAPAMKREPPTFPEARAWLGLPETRCNHAVITHRLIGKQSVVIAAGVASSTPDGCAAAAAGAAASSTSGDSATGTALAANSSGNAAIRLDRLVGIPNTPSGSRAKPALAVKRKTKKTATRLRQAVASGLVPKARNAYALFTQREMTGSVPGKQAGRRVSDKWRALQPAERAPYKEAAAIEKIKQKAALATLGVVCEARVQQPQVPGGDIAHSTSFGDYEISRSTLSFSSTRNGLGKHVTNRISAQLNAAKLASPMHAPSWLANAPRVAVPRNVVCIRRRDKARQRYKPNDRCGWRAMQSRAISCAFAREIRCARQPRGSQAQHMFRPRYL